MKLTLLCLPIVLLPACTTIDNAAEAAKLEAAGQAYRLCLVDRIRSKQGNIDLYCRSARIGLFQAVMADPRRYEKSLAFNELAKNAIEMAQGDIELTKDAEPKESNR